jgi:formylglycine-generating enzyme
VSKQPCFMRVTLAAVALVAGCTTDFTGYHLASDSGTAGEDTSGQNDAGGANSGDRAGAGFENSNEAGRAGSSAGSSSAGEASQENAGATGSDVTEPSAPPSCADLPSSCGSDQSASCCAASVVPGGTYNRSNLPSAPATVSAFALDEFEISVGRVRNFVHAYSQTMTPAGSGKNPGDARPDPGWSPTWNAKLPATAALLSAALSCPNGTFTASAGANENLPATCLSWYEAYAFCIWDGGRLPTEAEWNYAAAAGSEERVHPWGGAIPDDSFAVFCPGSCGKVQAVGSKPAGNGKWGHADLVGNAWEWNLDAFANPYAQASCVDCANTSAASTAQRTFRGGSAGNDASYLLSSTRSSRDPSDHNGFVGARCARSP